MSRSVPVFPAHLRIVATAILSMLALATLVSGGSAPATAGEPDITPVAAKSARTSEFRLVGTENFNRLNRSRWHTYAGRPGCCPDTWWDRSRVRVRKGALRVWNGRNSRGEMISGGVSAQTGPFVRTYGRFQARIAISGGAGSSGAALLWPTQGWPPEIDFFEFDHRDAARRQLMLTHHYNSGNRMSQTFIRGDFKRLHTVTVEWTPKRLDYFLDGRLVKRERDTSKIPDQPMFPAFQMQVHRNSSGQMPTKGSTMSVASLKVWAWQG